MEALNLLKNDILASALFLSLLPYIVLCESNDNLLQNNRKRIEDAANINAEEYSSLIPTQHLKLDRVSSSNVTILKGTILLILEYKFTNITR